jgi:hypothetical protein
MFLPDMIDVIVTRRRRGWEWRLHGKDGAPIVGGRERTRSAARYQGYRNLFMLLAVGRRSTVIRISASPAGPDASSSAANRPSSNSVRPKTGLSQ